GGVGSVSLRDLTAVIEIRPGRDRHMRRFAKAFAGGVLACVLAATGAAAAPAPALGDDAPADRQLPGLEDGQAYMGWSLAAERAQEPHLDARSLAPASIPAPPGVQGIDVSSWQGQVD